MLRKISIDIVSDTICPWCYVGKKNLETALKKFPAVDFQVTWHPFFLNPFLPEEGVTIEQYLGGRYGPGALTGMMSRLDVVGKNVGIEFTHKSKIVPTVRSHRLVKFAKSKGKQTETVEALFKAYFTDGKRINDLEVLGAVATTVGLDKEEAQKYLKEHEGSAEIEKEIDDYASKYKIRGVPFFIIRSEDKKKEEILSGGQPPEVFAETISKLTA
eukprot:TRINITY_DN1308_c0_g1_i2.p1 TRINITY_DN1308_c0_g1~~TRINITY_DN1308_c0_g1_i2.p1  ORF type:complete len:215 (-),score=14.64 TRINITY_DN1308_c0_g1_i2:85-729(-)